jgi:glycosyltransferase involved in cell wall biosynthesis
MRKALLVTPDLAYTGTATQVTLLALGLPRDRLELRVCVLADEGSLGSVLRAAGVAVEALGWKRALSVAALLRLRQLRRTFRPDVIHAWRPEGLRAVALTGRSRPVVVSRPLGPVQGKAPRPFDRWLLGRATCVVATGQDEADRVRQLGLDGATVRVVPLGSAGGRPWAGRVLQFGKRHPLPGRYLLCAGPLEPHKGFRDAIWAFDVLRRLYSDLHLVVVGTGSERPRLEQFVECICLRSRVHFIGDQEDMTELLAGAEVVWVPSRVNAGLNVALEAMAAGRPVVASRLPGLAEVVADGATGLLVPQGDKVALARQTRLLLDDAARRQALGEAGRQRVRRCFAADDLVRRYADLYEEVLN